MCSVRSFFIRLMKRYAFACLFSLYLALGSSLASAQIQQSKLTGFSITECNKAGCFSISGPAGYSSSLSNIFSSEKTMVKIFDKNKNSQNFYCDEFTLEVSDKIATCLDHKNSKAFEFNFTIQKVNRLSL